MSLEILSPEEDNEEDPCRSIRPPSDDRERMLHLETAVAWIKQQVDVLRNYDREILQDLWKVRSNIHDIRELQKQVIKDESRFLDDSMTASEDGTLHRSMTPTAKHSHSNMGMWRSTSSGPPAADLPPPAHLLQPIRPPEVTEGSTPIIVRKLMNLSNGGEAPGVVVKEGEAASTGKGAWSGKKDVESVKDEETLVMVPQGKQVEVGEVKILGTTDVISDMQKLRLRLEEECRKELAAMDLKFQTRIPNIPESSSSRPGSAPSQRKELQGVAPSHSRVSSDASDHSGPTAVNHKRDYSLPVNLETQTNMYARAVPAGDKAPHTPPQSSFQVSSHHSSSQVLSAERVVVAATSNNNNNNGFSTPPPIRSPPVYPQPMFQSFRQNNRAPRSVQFTRTSSGSVPSSASQQQGLTQSCDFSSSDVPIQVGGTHYSTLVVKGRKKGHASHPLNTDGAGSEQQQQYGLGTSGESPFYDRLGPHLVDQPEQKAVPLQLGNVQSSQQQQQQQQQSQLKLAPQQQPALLPARSSTLQGAQRSHSKLETRSSVPLMQLPPPPPGVAMVHPEVIQPYMSTHEVQKEMKKYVPFADKKRKSGDGTNIPEQTWC